MQEDNLAQNVFRDAVTEFEQFITQPNALRSILILFVSIIVAYWLSSFLAKGIIKIAQTTARRSDSSTDELHQWRLRRIETYLSITVAIVRVLVVAIVAFYAWQFLSPAANTSVAAIGAGAFFIVVAGGTIGVMLRDLTSGTAMIAEQWYNVGDHIKVEPFIDVNGVVERATLRSTKLRSLSGEVIWLHNQYIHGVRVTPKGVRTIAIDLFVNDEKRGKTLATTVIETIPVGTLLIAKKPTIQHIDKWGDCLWRIIIYGYTAPGREWLMEQLFVDMIISTDKKENAKSVLAYPPIVRHADPEAERNFKRAIKIK